MLLSIIDPMADGHHMVHVRYLTVAAMARGWDVELVTTPETVAHPAFRELHGAVGPRLRVRTLQGFRWVASRNGLHILAQQRRAFGWYRQVGQRLPEVGTGVAYIVNMDYFDKIASVLGSPLGEIPFSGMLMSVKFHHRGMGILGSGSRCDRIAEWSFLRLLRIPSLRSLVTIDELLPEHAARMRYQNVERISYAPDIGALSGTETREEARAALGLPRATTLILVYGSVSPRKGVAELLDAASSDRWRLPLKVLVAGANAGCLTAFVPAPIVQEVSRRGRLMIIPRYLSEREEYRVFQAADIVWLGYRRFCGMSGVLLQAARAGRPILACREGLIGWLCRKHNLGEIIEPGERSSICAALDRLMDPDLRQCFRNRVQAFGEQHTPDRFGEALFHAVSKQTGRTSGLW